MALTVKPFVQADHENVIGFLKLAVTAGNDIKATHTPQARGGAYYAASAVLAAAAAFAFSRAQSYVALGLGVLSLASLVYSRTTVEKKTAEFAAFEANCNQAAQHLTDAFTSKAEFMIGQVAGTKDFKADNDKDLQNAYLDLESDELDDAKINANTKGWSETHAALAGVVGPLNLDSIKAVNVHVTDAAKKVSTARDLFLAGQSPIPASQTTYVNYTADKVAKVWSEK